MKAKALSFFLAAVVLSVGAAALTHRLICGRMAIPSERLADAAFLAKTLHLSPAQTESLKGLQADANSRLADCCARHCTARARLGALVSGGSDDSESAQAAIRDMARAYEESEQLTWTHIRQVRAKLNPAQQKHYDELIMGSLFGSCNMSRMPSNTE